MKSMRLVSIGGMLILFILMVGSSINPVEAEGGAPWQVFHHDLQHTGRSAFQGPQNAGLVWSFPLEGYPGSPIIGSDGTIYLPTGWLNEDTVGYLYAINPDGTQKWRTTLAILPGYSAPALAPDGTLYILGSGTEGNIAAIEKLYSINPVDGSINWTFLPNDNFAIFTTLHPSSPMVIADGTIYFGSINTNFFALNPDGTVKWWDSPSATSFTSSPSVAQDGTIYIVDECTTLFAYNPLGVLQWQYDPAPATCASNYSAPAIGADGTIYFGEAANNSLHAVNPDGTLQWSFPTGHQIESTVAIGTDGTLYLGSDGLYAINPDGTQRWRFVTPYAGDTSPILGSDGMLYWRTWWDYYFIKPDGTQRYTFDMGSSLAWGQESVIGPDGTLYVPYADDFTPANNSLKAYRTIPLPDPFGKTGPVDGAIDQPINSLVLEWQSTPGAVSYSSCYYKDGGSCTWINNGTATTRTLSSLQRGTAYYWRVKAFNSLGDPIEADGGAIWSFTTLPNPPADFSKVTPTGNSTGVAVHPSLNLSWNPSAGATSYQYCVYPQASSCSGWSTTTGTSAQVTGLLPFTWYSWQVNAVNAGGTTVANYGSSWLFRSASLPGAFGKSAPANSSTNQLVDLTLSWTPSANATGYEYCIDTFPNGTCDTSWSPVAGTSVMPGLAWMTIYSWQVRALGGGSTDADGGTWWTFATGPEPPDDFSKTAPLNGSANQSSNPTLYWNPSPGVSSYEYCYYSTDSTDCNEPWTLSTLDTSLPLSGLTANTTYHWQVRARNTSGVTPANSGAWWTFTTLPDPPSAFGKSAPADASVGQSLSPTLSWSASSGVSLYEYCYYSTNAADCSEPWTLSTSDTSVPLSGLTAATTYHWQVRAYNPAATTPSDSGTWWTFTTLPAPGAFAKLTPANLSHNNPFSGVTLSWTSSANAIGYEYCFETYLENATAGCDTSWQTGITGTSVTAPVPTEWDQTYYWQVRAVGGGTTEADGDNAFWEFDTAYMEPPSAFSKTSPLNSAVKVSLTPTLSWETSNNSTYYRYCYYTSNPADCAGTWSLTTTSTSVVLSGLTPNITYHWGVRACNDIWCVDAGPEEWWTFTTIQILNVVLRSTAAQDGWLLESGETTNVGGTMNSADITLRLGDDAAKKQYRSILSFATGTALPDTAVITKVTLKVKKQGITGPVNPVTAFLGFMLDIRKGTLGTASLQATDWQALASKTLGPFSPALTSGWYVFDMTPGKASINKLATGSGLTQIRLRFKIDDNNNGVANYLSLYSGNYATLAARPTLIIEYYIP